MFLKRLNLYWKWLKRNLFKLKRVFLSWRLKSEDLKEEYIECLPYLVVTEIDKVRTKLDVEMEKNIQLEHDLQEKTDEVSILNERVDSIEKILGDFGIENIMDKVKK